MYPGAARRIILGSMRTCSMDRRKPMDKLVALQNDGEHPEMMSRTCRPRAKRFLSGL